MTDTAIPIPDDAQARIDQQTNPIRDALTALAETTTREAERVMQALGGLQRDMERSADAAGRVLGEHMEASTQRWRVRNLMPKLGMKEVLVHGYTPYKET